MWHCVAKKKVWYVDTETTGLLPATNDVIQIAGIIEVNGVVKEEFEFKCQPFSYKNISPEALDIHGYSVDDLKQFDPPRAVQKRVLNILGKYVNKYDKQDKYYPAGYQVSFDMDFLKHWFTKCGDPYFGSWVNGKAIDPLQILRWWDFMGLITLPSYKLEVVCKRFGIDLDAHDALSDTRAVRELLCRMARLAPEPSLIFERMATA